MKRILWMIAVVAAVTASAACGGGGSSPSLAPATPSPLAATPTATPVPVYTDPPGFAASFLQCSPGELRMPFGGTNTYVVTVFGMEAGKCHYASKVVDPKGAVIQNGGDCRTAPEMPYQGVEDSHQPFGRSSFRQQVTSQCEHRDCRQRRIGNLLIVLDRHHLDGNAVSPKKDKRGAAQGDENGSSQYGCGQQDDH